MYIVQLRNAFVKWLLVIRDALMLRSNLDLTCTFLHTYILHVDLHLYMYMYMYVISLDLDVSLTSYMYSLHVEL